MRAWISAYLKLEGRKWVVHFSVCYYLNVKHSYKKQLKFIKIWSEESTSYAWLNCKKLEICILITYFISEFLIEILLNHNFLPLQIFPGTIFLKWYEISQIFLSMNWFDTSTLLIIFFRGHVAIARWMIFRLALRFS